VTAEPEIAPEIAAEITTNAAADPDLDAKAAQQAAQAFGLLIKGLKNIAIYRHAESRYGEYLDPAYRALTQFLGDHQNLPLKLGPYTLEYNKHVIYEEQSKENLTYRFYRDGMRFLVFREGLELDELLRFMLLAIDTSSDAQLQQEDMITRLWKESFQHIEYVVVEGFEFGELSQDQVEIEVEKIVGYLRQQLAANSDDITRFARLSVEDLELELNDIEQVRGNIISGRTARDDDRARIQEELFLEEKKRVFAKMVLILFQILERDSVDSDYELMAESFAQVLDTLLLSEDVGGSVAVLHRFDQIAQRPTLDAGQRALVARIRENFARRMAEPQRLEAVSQYMTLTQHLDPLAVKAYLSVLDAGAIPMLCDMLEGMERAEARQVLIEVLADIGKDQAGVFAQRLDSKSSNVVRDMLAIIDIIDPPDKISLYGHLLEHPNLMIRLEGLKIMSKSRTEVAIKHLEKAMHDQDIQMRLGAYRALAASHPARAVPAFKTLMRSETYLARDRREQLAIAIALGETRAPDALAFFESLFDTKGSLFQRGKVNDLKLMAVRGLAAMRSVDAFKLLTNQLQNRAHGKDLLQEIHKTALWLRGELTGQVQ
jgi:hypothetical protein